MPNRALTDEDIKLLHETFASKDDVRKIVKEEVGLLPTKDEFATAMSELMGEVKAMRESQELHSQKHADINDKFETVGTKLKLDLSF